MVAFVGGGLALAHLESRYNADSLQVNGNVLQNKYKCRETLNREGSESVSLKPFRFGGALLPEGQRPVLSPSIMKYLF